MAKISHSEAAPSEAVHYSFAAAEFDLGGKSKVFETDDASIISEAMAHPWLSVEVDPATVVQGAYVEQIRPEDDPMSRVNSIANDPEAVKAAEEAKAEAWTQPVAIEAGLDQSKPVEVGQVAFTLAADTTDDKKKDKS